MLEIVVVSLVNWVIIVGGYVVYNLFQKNKKLESIIVNQENTINEIQEAIASSDRIINSMEVSGAFKADDEIGQFFKNLQIIQQQLNSYYTVNSRR